MTIGDQPGEGRAERFDGLHALRTEHVTVMRAVRGDKPDEEKVRLVRHFVNRAAATGALIDSPVERDAAQCVRNRRECSVDV